MSGILPNNALLHWLQDDSNDEFLEEDALATMYSYFAMGANDPLPRVKGDDRYHCFITFQKDSGGNAHCTILHHLARVPTRMGTDTPYNGNWYMTGDQPIDGNQITYSLPGSLLAPQAEVQVFTPEKIQLELTADSEVTQLDMTPTEANLEDLVMVGTRRSMWIPNLYASLCLEDGLTPVDVWSRVYGNIVRNGHAVVCAPLVQFLQYQLLGSHPSNTAIFTAQELVQPRVTSEFLRHHSSVLSHLIPPSSAGMNAGMSSCSANNGPLGMAPTQFQDFLKAMRQGHTAPAPAAAPTSTNASGTVEKRWNINLATLLKYNLVGDVKQLPPVWAAIAKGPRKDERNILQAALDNLSHSPGASTNAKLTVSKELLSTVVNLSFWSGDFNMLEEGLHPFRTVYVSTAKQAQDQAHLQTYDALAREGTLRLEGIQLFQLVLKSHWPSEYLQLDTTLRLFHNLLSVLLRQDHPLLASYTTFIKSWTGMRILLSEYFSGDNAKPAQFLRTIQLRVAMYWQTMSGSDLPTALTQAPPNFHEVLMSVCLQTWVPPSMPGQPQPLLPPTAPANPSPSMGSGSLPGAPAPPPVLAPAPAPAPAPSGPRQFEIRNERTIPEVVSAMNGRSFQIRTLFGRGRSPPAHSDGRPMCCVYHLRGRCSNTCSRAYSHTTLNEAEKTTLLTFVNERIVGPDVGRGATPPASS